MARRVNPPAIAIIGGGFSGTLLAAQLARRAFPGAITLYDAENAFGRGLAYGTRDPAHLLNVPAIKMGAFASEPTHFYHWLRVQESQWRALHPKLRDLVVTEATFMPRLVYGAYLRALLEEARALLPVTLIPDRVEALAPCPQGFELHAASGTAAIFQHVVIATGNMPARTRAFEAALAVAGERYLPQFWDVSEATIQRIKAMPHARILIIGTGLSMIDAALSLRDWGLSGPITALSRHGLLPQPHDLSVTPALLAIEHLPAAASKIVQLLRREAARNGDWRASVDALRADTPRFWAELSIDTRRRLLRALPYWSVHRHRMPPASAAFLARERQAGRFDVKAGHIATCEANRDGVTVTLRSGEKLVADYIINCTGAELDIRKSPSPLFRQLLARGLLASSPLGLGIVAAGTASGLHVIGPLRTHDALEAIAVPELREQAADVAATITTPPLS